MHSVVCNNFFFYYLEKNNKLLKGQQCNDLKKKKTVEGVGLILPPTPSGTILNFLVCITYPKERIGEQGSSPEKKFILKRQPAEKMKGEENY